MRRNEGREGGRGGEEIYSLSVRQSDCPSVPLD